MIRLKKVLVLRKSIALKLIKDPCLLPGCVYKAFPPGKYWLSKALEPVKIRGIRKLGEWLKH